MTPTRRTLFGSVLALAFATVASSGQDLPDPVQRRWVDPTAEPDPVPHERSRA